jgi:hypothetical protein
MRVRTTTPWSGHDFNLVPGDEIDLPDDVAQARINAGLAEAVETEAEAPETVRRGPGRPRKQPE